MATITIKGERHEYRESDIITFPEGLIGLPQFRRAVVVSMKDLEPFCWLAPVDEAETRFIVVDPEEVFDGYVPSGPDAEVQNYAIVTIASDWTQTTINLRAPISVDRKTRSGSQRILTDSPYHFAERLPRI